MIVAVLKKKGNCHYITIRIKGKGVHHIQSDVTSDIKR